MIKVIDLTRADLVVDAGELPAVPPSTMIDLTGNYWKILRQGPIREEEIKQVLNSL